MSNIQVQLAAFKEIVIENCKNPSFSYREWFVPDHLNIVERIALELCALYPAADKDAVFALVWFHDFGKPLDEANEYEVTKLQGPEAMRKVGLPETLIQKVLQLWMRMEMKNNIDISKEPIEVQIISTADGASHFVGKFYSSYFRNDVHESFESVQKRINDKIEKDWSKKIVLPEVRQAFKERYLRAKEIVGQYPDTFII